MLKSLPPVGTNMKAEDLQNHPVSQQPKGNIQQNNMGGGIAWQNNTGGNKWGQQNTGGIGNMGGNMGNMGGNKGGWGQQNKGWPNQGGQQQVQQGSKW